MAGFTLNSLHVAVLNMIQESPGKSLGASVYKAKTELEKNGYIVYRGSNVYELTDKCKQQLNNGLGNNS